MAALLALFANLFFAGSSISYSNYSKRYGSLWVNSFKTTVSFFCMVLPFIFLGGGFSGSAYGLSLLILSGLLGLALGDYFLIVGFFKIGPARTLLLFGVQPILFYGIDRFYFKEELSKFAPLGIALMLFSLCLVVFERKRKDFSWSVLGLVYALFGVLLDFVGVLLTKQAMNLDEPPIVAVHFWRSLGALAGLYGAHVLLRTTPFKFSFGENLKARSLFVLACFFGTFLSLVCYLKAIEIGPLSSISAVAITGPLFAGVFEWIWFKRPITPFLMVSFLFFGAGFYVLS